MPPGGYLGARAAAIAIEALARGEIQRAAYTRLCASIWIQTYVRGFVARVRFGALRRAAVRAQTRLVRGQLKVCLVVDLVPVVDVDESRRDSQCLCSCVSVTQ